MGVTWVFPYPTTEGSGTQTVKDIDEKLAAAGAVSEGVYAVDCTQYNPQPELGVLTEPLFVCHHSDYPESSFTVVGEPWRAAETGARLHYATSDRNLDDMVAKLQPTYSSRNSAPTDVRGPRRRLGDFVVRVGTVTIASAFKGILVEVEYEPCVVATLCDGLMREFCLALLGKVARDAPTAVFRQAYAETYKPIFTMIQYLELFSNLRRAEAAFPPAATALTAQLQRTQYDAQSMAHNQMQ